MNATALKEIKRIRFATVYVFKWTFIPNTQNSLQDIAKQKEGEKEKNWAYFGSDNPENIYLKPDSSKTLGRQLPFVLYCSAGNKGVSVHSKSLKKISGGWI